jgi:hypothetical protein
MDFSAYYMMKSISKILHSSEVGQRSRVYTKRIVYQFPEILNLRSFIFPQNVFSQLNGYDVKFGLNTTISIPRVQFNSVLHLYSLEHALQAASIINLHKFCITF